MRALIYYPYINPPQSWIKHSLLYYWDRVSTIVHADFQKAIHPDLAWLLEQGVYEPLFPDDIPEEAVDSLRAEILHYLDSTGIIPLGAESWGGRGSERIHYGKLPGIIQDDLARAGHLRPSRGQLEVNSEVFGVLLSLVAKHLSQTLSHGERFYSVCTSHPAFAACSFEPLHSVSSETCIQLVLDRFLPVPRDIIPLGDILEFKRDHEGELLEFRRALDSMYSMLAQEGPEDRILASAVDEVRLGLSKVAMELRRSRMEPLLLSMSVLILLGTTHVFPGVSSSVQWLFDGIATAATTAFAAVKAVRAGNNKGPFSYLHRSMHQFAAPEHS